MRDLGTDSIATVNGFMEAFNGVKARVLAGCRTEEERREMRLAFADVTTRASQVKAHVMAMKVCLDVKEPKTLREVQEERRELHVPVLPDRELLPPPPNYQTTIPE